MKTTLLEKTCLLHSGGVKHGGSSGDTHDLYIGYLFRMAGQNSPYPESIHFWSTNRDFQISFVRVKTLKEIGKRGNFVEELPSRNVHFVMFYGSIHAIHSLTKLTVLYIETLSTFYHCTGQLHEVICYAINLYYICGDLEHLNDI